MKGRNGVETRQVYLKHPVEFDFTYDGLSFATLAFNNIVAARGR